MDIKFFYYIELYKYKLVPKVMFLIFFGFPSFCFGDNFLCRPWSNVETGNDIGASFTSKIESGSIFFIGENNPVAIAQLIYSHPLYDIFLAASGEIVTAGLEGKRIRINVYFPNNKVKYFVTTSCSRV